VHAVESSKRAHQFAGKSLAIGCKTLLGAQNNGKSEWFEKAAWYQKALGMCSSIAHQNPDMLDKKIDAHKKHIMSQLDTLKNKQPKELMKSTCMKMHQLPEGHEVRSQPWFGQAQKMCAVIMTKSPDQLQSMFRRSVHQAESAGGQLMKQTCSKFQNMEQFKHEAWHQHATAMCSKLVPDNFNLRDLAHKCARVQNLEEDSPVKKKPWYKAVATACKWINQKEFGQKQESNAAILV
jgi:hypothetical protein